MYTQPRESERRDPNGLDKRGQYEEPSRGLPRSASMAKSYRRLSTEFKLRLMESYSAGDGSTQGLADQAGLGHSPLHLIASTTRAS